MAKSTTFGDYIRTLRDEANLGLREASRLLNISSSYLSRLEAGDYPPPSGEALIRIAQLYGADKEEILRLAQSRAHEMMAADADVAPAVQAFYRLAQDQTPEMQEQMLKGAIGALNLSDDQKQMLVDKLKAALSRGHGRDLPRRAKGDDGLFAFDIAPRILSKQYIENFAERVLKVVFGAEIPIPVPIETVVRKLAPDVVLIVDGEIEGGRLEGGAPAVLGLSRWSRDGERRELVIHEDLFDSSRTSTRRRANFTMAHELFHCLEHLSLVQDRNGEGAFKRDVVYVTLAPELLSLPWFERKRKQRKLSTNEDWREWQANAFGGALLMPAASVRTAFTQLVGRPTVQVEEKSMVGEIADEMARTSFEDEFGETTSLIERFDVNPQAMAIRLMALGLVSA